MTGHDLLDRSLNGIPDLVALVPGSDKPLCCIIFMRPMPGRSGLPLFRQSAVLTEIELSDNANRLDKTLITGLRSCGYGLVDHRDHPVGFG